ncbi:hypothetical protein ACFSUK_22445 [Sphingobium scionense]
MGKHYRVIQWATGNIGGRALRAVIEHPGLDLAGLWVSSAAKAGQDAGTLAGTPPQGIVGTSDVDALVATPVPTVSSICGKGPTSTNCAGCWHRARMSSPRAAISTTPPPWTRMSAPGSRWPARPATARSTAPAPAPVS